MTGLQFFPDREGNLIVTKVYPNSSAENANIEVNDIISHINDKEISKYKPGEIHSILKNEGDTLTLQILSEGITKTKIIELREIL